MTFWCMLPLGTYAQGFHWTCDERNFQYDMTIYMSLVSVGGYGVDLAEYEVAAFVGDECRGTVRVQTIPGGASTYGYLRIHSNVSSGETVTFKVYYKVIGAQFDIEAVTVTFEANDIKGLPSTPLILTLPSMLGDVNRDCTITIVDVTALVNIILRKLEYASCARLREWFHT